jgi:DNA polymerase-3 subunit epsilon
MDTFYLDIETTGLSAEKEYICEIAIVGGGEERGWLVKPPIDIPASATAIHNITQAMVAQAPPISSIIEQIKGILGDSCYIVAHNGDKFDRKFVEAEAKRHEILLPAGWIWLDSLKWARKYRPDLHSHKLQSLHVIMCGGEIENAHRAVDDCNALKRVCECMWGDLPMDQIKKLLYDAPSIKIFPWGQWKGVPIKDMDRKYASWVINKSNADKELKDALIKILFTN